jgi:xanthine phosphoribosyltransferase
MKLLEERIKKDGKILPGDILKVDSFLNHQVDIRLVDELGKEFYRLFENSNPTKILTIEASGIAISQAASRCFGFIPVVFAKKTEAANMDSDVYASKERSYTRNVVYNVKVAKEYLGPEDRVLILDDFLARGEAMASLIDICNQAGAKIVGCGSVISKAYQPGEKRISDMGYKVEVLARVKSMSEDGQIEFED